MEWLNYHHLFYFYTITKEGSITRASTSLHLAQSTLSAQLSQFENTIGTKLFERHGKKLRLSEAGQRVYTYAQEIFSLGAQLKDVLRHHDGMEPQRIEIGVVEDVAKVFACLTALTAVQGGQVSLSLREGHLDQLTKDLAEHQLDLVLTTRLPTLSQDMKVTSHLLGEVPLFFFGTQNFREFAVDFPRRLREAPLLLPGPDSSLRQELESFFHIKKIAPLVIAEIDDAESLRRLMLAGMGLALLDEASVQDELNAGKILRFGKIPLTMQKLWLLGRERLVPHPVADQLMRDLRLH